MGSSLAEMPVEFLWKILLLYLSFQGEDKLHAILLFHNLFIYLK